MKANMLAAGALVLSFAPVQAQNSTTDAIARYRELLQDANPAELVVARGEVLWKEKRGPKKVSLEQCDLGLGPGVVKGAYAQLPRYFADADKVMDYESRVVHCMVTLQGLDYATVTKTPYSSTGQRQTDIEALAAYGVEQSRGVPVKIPQAHPQEKSFLRSRQAAVLHARRPVRFFVRKLPRNNRSANPAAGSAEHRERQGRRSARVHDLARVSRLARHVAIDAVAAE